MANQQTDYIGIIERRRVRRRRLHESTTVRFHAIDPALVDFSQARMLNLSEQGLACRMPQAQADRLRIGQTLGVVFRLNEMTEPFDIPARIVTITQGGTTDQRVVGMEFLDLPELQAQKTRLGRALELAIQEPKADILE